MNDNIILVGILSCVVLFGVTVYYAGAKMGFIDAQAIYSESSCQ
jgi:hypothetical protein